MGIINLIFWTRKLSPTLIKGRCPRSHSVTSENGTRVQFLLSHLLAACSGDHCPFSYWHNSAGLYVTSGPSVAMENEAFGGRG